MAEQYDENLLLGYVEGELDESDRAAVDRWMAQDPRLAELVRRMIADREAMRRMPDPTPPEWLTEEVDRQLERQMLLEPMPSEQQGGLRRQRHLARRLALGGAVAAMVAVVAGVVIASLQGLGGEPLGVAMRGSSEPEPKQRAAPTAESAEATDAGTDSTRAAEKSRAKRSSATATAPSTSAEPAEARPDALAGAKAADAGEGPADRSAPSQTETDGSPAASPVRRSEDEQRGSPAERDKLFGGPRPVRSAKLDAEAAVETDPDSLRQIEDRLTEDLLADAGRAARSARRRSFDSAGTRRGWPASEPVETLGTQLQPAGPGVPPPLRHAGAARTAPPSAAAARSKKQREASSKQHAHLNVADATPRQVAEHLRDHPGEGRRLELRITTSDPAGAQRHLERYRPKTARLRDAEAADEADANASDESSGTVGPQRLRVRIPAKRIVELIDTLRQAEPVRSIRFEKLPEDRAAAGTSQRYAPWPSLAPDYREILRQQWPDRADRGPRSRQVELPVLIEPAAAESEAKPSASQPDDTDAPKEGPANRGGAEDAE